MNNLTKRILVTLFSVSIFGIVAFTILKEEQNKKQTRVSKVAASYADQYKSFSDYKKSYQEQVAQLKSDNLKKMDETKAKYNQLLALQPAQIKAHSRVVAQSSSVSNSATYTASSSSSGTTTKTTTVKVAKPAASTKTNAS